MVIRTAQCMAEIKQAKEEDSKRRKEKALEELERFIYFEISVKNAKNAINNNFSKVEISSGDYNLFNDEMEEILGKLERKFSDLGYKTTYSQDTENEENFTFMTEWTK